MAPTSDFQHSSRTVCVMDASSCLGSSLVDRLLQRGYTVHAALQNHCENQSPNNILNSGNKKLKIFNSDPFDYQSIVEALKGCSGLFYTFEPPQDQSTYDQEFMAEVEVRVAHNVLEACARTETIDKVVFTSSATAVIWKGSIGIDDPNNKSSLSDFDERDWTDITFCRKFKLWHAMSKTLAEKTAWALAMDREVNMVSINSGLLLSPDLSITNPYLKGAAEMYEDGVFVTVDLNFLLDAHICVFEDVSSYGRYLCFNHLINCSEDAIKLAQLLAPGSPQPPTGDQDMRMIQQRISNKKLNKLMVDFETGPRVE
nr:cinnamoyl-CoA reductase 1 [Vaccinium corymbosum]